MKKVLFRVDACSEIGVGHLVRCITLAEEFLLHGYSSDFFCIGYDSFPSNLTKNINVVFLKKKLNLNFECLNSFEEQDAQDTIDSMKSIYELIVVDHYCLGERWELFLKPYSKRMLVLDDMANRSHSCDFLLDSSEDRTINDYADLTQNNTTIFIGSRYVPLRRQFSKYREIAHKKRNACEYVGKVLISFGGTDPSNLTIKYSKYVLDLGLCVSILISSSCSNIDNIIEFSEGNENVNLFIDEDNVAGLIVDCDLAIASLGGSAWERCSLGLPTLGIIIADNQESIAKGLERIGAVKIIDNTGGVKNFINDIKNDFKIWEDMSNKSFSACEGDGANLVISNVLGLL